LPDLLDVLDAAVMAYQRQAQSQALPRSLHLLAAQPFHLTVALFVELISVSAIPMKTPPFLDSQLSLVVACKWLDTRD
jgi:hypothetical protein